MEIPKYWTKQEKPLFPDVEWNLPEQKQGSVAILGGNAQSFASVNRVAQSISRDFPVRDVICCLPDALRAKIPPVPNVEFFPSTESGSFAKSSELTSALCKYDFNLLIGDFSKNSETAVAVSSALANCDKPTVVTRDAVDLVLQDMGNIIEKKGMFFVGSMAQMQKILRAVYYPKMLLLSMPILSVIEVLHKFTLSYPVVILTFHDGQILVAYDGKVVTTPITKTLYSPISLWSGDLAGKIVALNMFNPGKPLEATCSAIF